MPIETRRQNQNAEVPKHKFGLFLWIGLLSLSIFLNISSIEATGIPTSSTVVEELNPKEKQSMADQLLAEGDRYMEEKNYDLANATYESVFLLDPNHREASKRIDRLKKQMKKEGKSEAGLVTRVYDAEIDMRVRQYLKEAKESMANHKWGKARFTLQKLLLINPLNEEARKLYAEVNQKSERQAYDLTT